MSIDNALMSAKQAILHISEGDQQLLAIAISAVVIHLQLGQPMLANECHPDSAAGRSRHDSSYTGAAFQQAGTLLSSLVESVVCGPLSVVLNY